MARIGLKNINMSFGTNDMSTTALENINLSIDDGDFVSLIGPSGCGKSTLLDLVAGLKKPTSGQVQIDGREIVGPGPDRGVVFQDYLLCCIIYIIIIFIKQFIIKSIKISYTPIIIL